MSVIRLMNVHTKAIPKIIRTNFAKNSFYSPLIKLLLMYRINETTMYTIAK
jgi:hypothetical protein